MGRSNSNRMVKQPDLHYENHVQRKERECSQQTTHEVGKSGSIRSRSRTRVTSRINAGGAADASAVASPSRSSGANKHNKAASPKCVSAKSPSACGGPKRSISCGTRSSRRHSAGGSSRSKGGKGDSKDGGTGRRSGSGSRSLTIAERCYVQPPRRRLPPCTKPPKWQLGKYVRDECGSGIVPKRFDFKPSRRLWCKTPLSMYQATIGELGRKLLCREAIVPRDVRPGPPCNVAEYILPPCGGYYRKYDCLRPCEEELVTYKQGKKVYRDRVERYWEPCLTPEQKHCLDINTFAGHNVALGAKLRRYNYDLPCW